MDEEASLEHLQMLAAQWRKAGLSVTTKLMRGDPALQILACAAADQVDLISLANHASLV